MSSAIGQLAHLGLAPRPELHARQTTRARALEPEHASRSGAPGTVAPIRTPLRSEQASQALSTAWQKVFGEAPSQETVAVLTAQWAHETGHGASMFNFNFGGIKGTGPSGLSVVQRTREGYGETERTITDRFRAYTDASEGAADYVSLLARRYPEAVDAARKGDPVGFVHALRERGYFTGDPSAYVRSVASVTRSLLGSDAVFPGETSPIPSLDSFAGARAAGGSAFASLDALDGYAGSGLASGPTAALSAELALSNVLALEDELSRAALRIAASSMNARRTEEPYG